MIDLQIYKKPFIAPGSVQGLIPAMVAFISPVAPIIAGAAAVAALSKKGNSIIDSTHTEALTSRKNFSLA